MYTDHHVEGYTEKQERERQHQQALADTFKELENWNAVFRGKLELGCRHGQTEAVMKQINDTSAEVGSCITRILDLMPLPMLPRKNRY